MRNAIANLAQTIDTGDKSFSETFKAIAKTPHIKAATTEYSIPLTCSGEFLMQP